jgi:hypothetical protein
MMPEDVEGSFDGGGSVRWEVIVEEDDDRQGHSVPHGATGRKSNGVDKRPGHGKYFRVVMKVPTAAGPRAAFLRQFNVPEVNGTIEVRLPLERIEKQIRVKWDADGPLPPATASST